MRLTADTNVLVRAVLQDDPQQAAKAAALLQEAAQIAVPLPCLCELVWVLLKGAKLSRVDVTQAVRALSDSDKVVMNRPAVEAGLAVLAAGGDFADGAIAFEGSWLGGDVFVSFDRKAVSLLEAQGHTTRLLS
ncbi:MAG: type II toxin-antitoxin system VapC family toxin [Burkholderiaceae bacterium]